MKAEIFSIGTEFLMGEQTDTNGPFIASKLPPLGIQLYSDRHLVAAKGVELLGLDIGLLDLTAVPGVTVMVENELTIKAFHWNVGDLRHGGWPLLVSWHIGQADFRRDPF